ncbi:hypothetical protein M413DRAFT_108715 [Hebeloma cylindrosporum]|uniref:Uncharacterized protein n=1 Tax=Hebeloma cylindrosporum TaxID=76867 RepID=A0A0C2Z8J6_HEBCY|nr:hypothetical protein M413DRAFT_108715 [Hebeloma cylindrosporum h7]
MEKANQACGHLLVRVGRPQLKEEKEAFGIWVSQRKASRICPKSRRVRFCFPMFNLHVTAIRLQASLTTALDFVFSPSQSHLVFRFSLSFNFVS